ncbi:MAG TPA: hypothetical protein VGO67_05435 [Verrucomicrobiae bacterium]|jgi:hypothetical protein
MTPPRNSIFQKAGNGSPRETDCDSVAPRAAISSVGVSISLRHPLCALATARDILGTNGDGVIALIDAGEIAFAFNVSSPTARNRDVRILSEALTAYVERRPCRVKSLADAVGTVLPAPSVHKGFSTIRRVTLSRRLGCSVDHIGNLVKAGQLQPAPLPVGKSESPLLLHQSVATWLSSRCLGVAAYAKPE